MILHEGERRNTNQEYFEMLEYEVHKETEIVKDVIYFDLVINPNGR